MRWGIGIGNKAQFNNNFTSVEMIYHPCVHFMRSYNVGHNEVN